MAEPAVHLNDTHPDAQSLAWASMNVLLRNWTVIKPAPAQGSVSLSELWSALPRINDADARVLRAFLVNRDAFSYIARLGRTGGGRIDFATLKNYSDE